MSDFYLVKCLFINWVVNINILVFRDVLEGWFSLVIITEIFLDIQCGLFQGLVLFFESQILSYYKEGVLYLELIFNLLMLILKVESIVRVGKGILNLCFNQLVILLKGRYGVCGFEF